MAGYLSASQLASARRCVTAFCPDRGRNSRTGALFPCEVEPDNHEHHLPGAADTVRMRRWVLTAPYGTAIARYDVIFVPSLAPGGGGFMLGSALGVPCTGPGYWTAEVKTPTSYATEVTVLAWQIYEADGAQVDPVTENCTVLLLRQGTPIGPERRARFMPAVPGAVGPLGERVVDTLWVSYQQASDWRLNDVCQITALDYFGALPAPLRYRVQEPRLVSEPPAFVAMELTGEGGSYDD